jgi:signal peptidase II
MPGVGGDHFIFFQPIFNIADAALSVGVMILIFFYPKSLSSLSAKKGVKAEEKENQEANK